jgi:hypothetical protein
MADAALARHDRHNPRPPHAVARPGLRWTSSRRAASRLLRPPRRAKPARGGPDQPARDHEQRALRWAQLAQSIVQEGNRNGLWVCGLFALGEMPVCIVGCGVGHGEGRSRRDERHGRPSIRAGQQLRQCQRAERRGRADRPWRGCWRRSRRRVACKGGRLGLAALIATEEHHATQSVPPLVVDGVRVLARRRRLKAGAEWRTRVVADIDEGREARANRRRVRRRRRSWRRWTLRRRARRHRIGWWRRAQRRRGRR